MASHVSADVPLSYHPGSTGETSDGQMVQEPSDVVLYPSSTKEATTSYRPFFFASLRLSIPLSHPSTPRISRTGDIYYT